METWVPDQGQVLEGTDRLLGGADVAVGFGEREVQVLRVIALLRHRTPLLQETSRNLLVLRETHRELLRHRWRHLQGLGARDGGELLDWGVRVVAGLGLEVSGWGGRGRHFQVV